MIDPDEVEGKAALYIDFEDRLTIFDSLILCFFYRDLYPWDLLGEIVHAATGFPSDKDSLKNAATAISNEVRRFNVREGLTRKYDKLPSRFHKEVLKSGHIITEEELSVMLSDYYRLRGWNDE
jgi:aldehyde:ferredoxin oxidoreductase